MERQASQRFGTIPRQEVYKKIRSFEWQKTFPPPPPRKWPIKASLPPILTFRSSRGGCPHDHPPPPTCYALVHRVSTIHDRNKSDRVSTRANSERGNRSAHVESSEDDGYLANSSLHSRLAWKYMIFFSLYIFELSII